MMTKKNTLNIILLTIVAIGIGLSIINFFSLRSLWFDEAMLAISIIKPTKELFKPLEYKQVAPIGFLLVENGFSNLFGKTDWSMRIFPMLLYGLSVYLVYSILSKIVQNKTFTYLGLAFYCTTYAIIKYSSEVKQYISDVTVCLLIIFVTIIITQMSNKKHLWFYSLLGVVAIWFSNVSIIVLFTSGLYFLYVQYKSGHKNYLTPFLIIGSWIISFAVYYVFFIHNHPTREYMVEFWSFIPQNILSIDFYKELLFKLSIFLNLYGVWWISMFCIPFFFIGIYFLRKNKPELLYLFLAPVVVHLFLNYLQLYPFSVRLILYLYAYLLLVTIYGAYSLFLGAEGKKQQLIVFVLVIPLSLNILNIALNGFPTDREAIKKPLSYLNENIKPNDHVYFYYGARKPFRFYKDQYPKISETEGVNLILTKSSHSDWSKYEKPIENLHGRVWILFSHVHTRKKKKGKNAEEYIVSSFKKHGFNIKDKKSYKGCSIYCTEK